MKIGTTKLIAENIAPANASGLVIFDGDTKICNVDISKMKPDLGEKKYSFGLVSDMHLDGVTEVNSEGLSKNGAYLDEALTFFENQGCSFCCHAGDMTNVGFWGQLAENNYVTSYYTTQMEDFEKVILKHKDTLPIHGICGNHESFFKSITENLTELKTYTGRELCYTLSNQPSTVGDEGVEYPNYYSDIVENDVFIFMGQPGGTGYVQESVWKKELEWLETTLETNKNKRCFVFEHSPVADDSGNPQNIHNSTWALHESEFIRIMRTYPNAIAFHGHAHLDFNEQLNWSYSNYSTRRGFKSVHIPSSAGGRITANGVLDNTNRADLRSGYIADVYKNCIVLKGYYFKNFELVPIAQYRINTD